jgi:hypothetical protein
MTHPEVEPQILITTYRTRIVRDVRVISANASFGWLTPKHGRTGVVAPVPQTYRQTRVGACVRCTPCVRAHTHPRTHCHFPCNVTFARVCDVCVNVLSSSANDSCPAILFRRWEVGALDRAACRSQHPDTHRWFRQFPRLCRAGMCVHLRALTFTVGRAHEQRLQLIRSIRIVMLWHARRADARRRR